METMKVQITLTEEMLGMASSNPDIHDEFIASKAPDAPSREEEIEALGVEAVQAKGKTIFPRDQDGNPIMWDYQIKGFFKDACKMLKKVPDTKSSKVKAYKQDIDGLIFVSPRMIPIKVSGEIGNCQRPLRAQTMQGERVSLASSETIPAGSEIVFEVRCLRDGDLNVVREWLDYGMMRGLGQWRNSGKGTFCWTELSGKKAKAK